MDTSIFNIGSIIPGDDVTISATVVETHPNYVVIKLPNGVHLQIPYNAIQTIRPNGWNGRTKRGV